MFPDLINLKRPTLPVKEVVEDGVSYTVGGAIENVYASLVVLLGYTQTFTQRINGKTTRDTWSVTVWSVASGRMLSA